MLTGKLISWYLHASFSPQPTIGINIAPARLPEEKCVGTLRSVSHGQRIGKFVSNSISAYLRSKIALVAILILAGTAGCRQGIVYDAATLPDEFRAVAAAKVDTINLARLAAPGSNSTMIGPGDIVELTVTTGFEEGAIVPLVLRVDDNGIIRVPLVGSVKVAGLEPAQAENTITNLAIERGVYRSPSIVLIVTRQQSNQITIVGAVEAPGVYELPRASSDLLGALAMAGGRTEDAGPHIEILRNNQLGKPGLPGAPPQGRAADKLASYTPDVPVQPVSTRVNLDLISQGQVGDYRLGEGDVVMVYPQDPRVIHVLGLVNEPGRIEIPPGEDVHLLDALALAGGRTLQIADKVQIVRRVPGQSDPLVIDVSVNDAKALGAANLLLAPGDMVSVEETPTTLTLSLLKSFMRFGISASAPIF